MGLKEVSEFQCMPKVNCCGINAANNYVLIRAANVLAFVVMVLLNALASTGVIGNPIGEVSDSHPTYFTPASSAFSIWGLIYALMALFVLYQALPGSWPEQKSTQFLYEEIGWLFVTQAVWNSAWIIVFAQNSIEPGSDAVLMWVAAVIICCLLLNLVWIYVKVQAHREDFNLWEMLSLMVGWSIYTAWVTAATILNIATALWTSGVNKEYGYDEETAAIVMIVIALLLYIAITYSKGDPIYGLTFGWVTFWQADARSNKTALWGDYTTYSTSVMTADYVACAVIVAISVVMFVWAPGKPWNYFNVWAQPNRKGKPTWCCGGKKDGNKDSHGAEAAELQDDAHSLEDGPNVQNTYQQSFPS